MHSVCRKKIKGRRNRQEIDNSTHARPELKAVMALKMYCMLRHTQSFHIILRVQFGIVIIHVGKGF